MSKQETTKLKLADALKRLMSENPLSKVSVLDVANDCSISRKSFYYHFADKFELFNFIYRTELIESIAECSDVKRWKLGLAKALFYLEENKAFYSSALEEQGPDPFSGYLFEAIVSLNLKVAEEFSKGLGVAESDKIFIAEFFASAYVSVVVRWIKAGMKESSKELAERIVDIVDGSMRRAIERKASHRGLLLSQRIPE